MSGRHAVDEQIAIGRVVHQERHVERYGLFKRLAPVFKRGRVQLWRCEQVYLAHCAAVGIEPLDDVPRETDASYETAFL